MKIWTVGNSKFSVELESPFPETAENTNNLLRSKQLHLDTSAVAALCRIVLFQAESIQCPSFPTQQITKSVQDRVLKHGHVEPHESRCLMGFLQTAWIKRDGETLLGVGQEVTQNAIGVPSLRLENVDRPYRVLRPVTELYEEHLSKHKLDSFSAFFSSILSACVFVP